MISLFSSPSLRGFFALTFTVVCHSYEFHRFLQNTNSLFIKKRHFDHFCCGISWEEKPYGPYETMMVTATRKSNRFDEQNNNSAHASHFFELSLQ